MSSRLWAVWSLLLLLASGSAAPAANVGQCVSTAVAGGTANAMTISALPCTPTSTLLLLSALGPNTITTPTLQMTGQAALTIVRNDGTALGLGDIANGMTALMQNTGTQWKLLNPSNAVSGAAGGDLSGTFPNPTVVGGTHLTGSLATGLNLATPSAVVLTNGTGLPLASGVSGTLAAANMLPLTSAHIYVGNGSNLPTDVAMSGDCSLTNAGVISCSSGTTTPGPSAGRLTLASGTPVMTSSQSGKTTIYWTPYHGSLVWVYTGAAWAQRSCAEVSNVTTNSAVGNAGPAAVTTNSNYDLYIWFTGGNCVLTRSPAWSSNTSRGAGAGTAEQTKLNGVVVNAQAITNGPAANQGTYVGSVRSDGSSQINYIFGASASGGTAGVFGVWNQYNRVSACSQVMDSGVSYTYSSATIRQARASAGNQNSFLLGLQEDAVTAEYTASSNLENAVSSFAKFGISSVDSTTLFNSQFAIAQLQQASASSVFGSTASNAFPAGSISIGYHTIAALEASDGSNPNFFDNYSVNTFQTCLMN